MNVLLALLASAPALADLPSTPSAASVGPARLDLNRGSATELAAIPMVGEDTAKRIVDLRGERERLGSVEELRVLGLDEPVLASLRSHTALEVEVGDAPVTTFQDVDQVLAQFANEPTVQQAQMWANEYSNTSPTQVSHWLAQSVTFATLPEVTLEYRLRNDYDQGFEYQDADGASPVAGALVIPVAQDADQGQTQEYKVKLNWELDRLVMSSEKIRVINEAQDIVKLRDKVLSEVTRL
ncbi:MAG: helix-hairpin-helix domain-containing protein, partial [Myxococcales bacterium]|nr:helix-hairpin-helix domain-containing protein [Myxococcales bacterium]